MVSTIQVLAGPAGSGKTDQLLSQYRAFLRETAAHGDVGRALWLAPTHHAAALIRGSLPNETLPACFRPQVFTFTGFAERILRDCPADISPIAPLQQRLLLRRIVEDFHRAGNLPHFGPVAETSGFLDQISSLISELKRGEIWPDAFEEAVQTDRPRDRELAAIYREYQDHLHQTNLYDSEGRFWSARDQLSQDHWGDFADLQLVVVDGFTDFTHTQFEILQLIADRTETVIVTLPWEEPLYRQDLFAKSAAVLEQLGTKVTVDLKSQELSGDQQPVAMRRIAETLFRNPREVTPAAASDGVEILAMTGQRGELRAIAREVKQFLIAGVSPTDIVVAFRSPDEYGDLVNEMFTDAGIPFANPVQHSLAQIPVVKALVALLRAEADDWSHQQLLSCLQNNYFQPQWAEYDNGTAIRAVSTGLRRLKLRRGRNTILNRLASAAQKSPPVENLAPTQIEQWQESQRTLQKACDFLNRLAEALKPLQSARTMQSWAETLVQLGREVLLIPGISREGAEADELPDSRDVEGWRVFVDSLFACAAVEERFPGGPRKLRLSQFLPLLTDLLQDTRFSIPDSPHGKVRVLEATQVRNLDVPYLFLGGLTETGFPQRRGDDCFFSEAERQDFQSRGISLRHRVSQTQDEMLLFYGVVTRARRKLALSYPAVNEEGQPLLPSPYLLALEELFTDDAVTRRQQAELDPVPKLDSMLTDEDLRVVAMDRALHKQPELLGSLFSRPDLESVGRNLLAAVDAAEHRFHVHGFTGYEGLIEAERYKQSLQPRFSTEHQFSATELEKYADCPFKFFMSYVLNLRPPETVEIETDYGRRGDVMHNILKRLHQEFSADRTEATPAQDPISSEDLSARFQALVEEQFQRIAELPDLQQVLAQIEEQLLSEWGTEYGNQWAGYVGSTGRAWDVPPEPQLFEIAFGAAPGGASADTAEHRYDCLELGVAHRKVRVRGRIDRIDVGKIGGKTAFNVVDYKTGSAKNLGPKQVREIRSIQLPLYALAAHRLSMVAEDALPHHLAYWFIKERGYKNVLAAAADSKEGLGEHDDWVQVQKLLEDYVPQLVADIRSGIFAVFSRNTDCTSRCPYSKTCRVGQIRPLEEQLHKTLPLGKSYAEGETEMNRKTEDLDG